ncbi:MAG: hypothetical protein HRT69_10515 [Flavobacteriaceae bacterium]|nr:hypothetical protein [Flavobacteriaceae bacterium]
MKYLLLFFICLISVSCSNDKELLGTWYGHWSNHKEKAPILFKFEENTLIDYFSSYDTLKYHTSKNKLIINTKTGEKNTIIYKIEKSELQLFDSTNDSLLFTLKKSKKKIFSLDYLSDKSLKIELPEGNGIEKKYSPNFKFNEPLYIAYKNNQLVANFRGITQIVDENFHEFVSELAVYNFDEKFYVSISIIADKNTKLKDIESINRQIRLADLNKVNYILSSNKYEFSKVFPFKLPRLSTKEISKYNLKIDEFYNPWTPYKLDSSKCLIINIEKSKIIINNEVVNHDNLKAKIISASKKDPELIVLYNVSDNSEYQDYITTLDIVYNSIIELRNEYLLDKYNIEYSMLTNSDEIKEAKKKIPFIFLNIENFEF